VKSVLWNSVLIANLGRSTDSVGIEVNPLP
jgi:hypothetical protein